MKRSKINDSFRFVRKSSISKWYNASKILISYYLSKSLKRPLHWGLPISISIEPTTACNLHCTECPSGLRSFTRPTGNLKMELFHRFLKEAHKHIMSLTFYFQGEPFIHPRLLEMISMAHQLNIYTIVSTNAHFLDPATCQKIIDSGLDRIIISLDGINQETYQKYRIGGQVDKVIQGIENLVEAKRIRKSSSPYLILQTIVFKHNEQELGEIKLAAEKWGVDHLEFKTAQIYDYQQKSNLIPEQALYARYGLNDQGEWSIKNKLQNHCWRMWQGCVISWDGRVVPCCFDKDAKYQFGQIGDEKLSTIWRNKAYQNFRHAVLQNRKSIDICTNCTEGGFT